MSDNTKKLANKNRDHLVAAMRQEEQQRQSGYREQALKLFPHVCARCCREFEGQKLRELTVHHIDHNHDNNPPDGSNWVLLCIYCHDYEHTRGISENHTADTPNDKQKPETLSHSPFAILAKNFKNNKNS